MLLHSETHPTLDYTAQAEDPPPSADSLTHYIGIYDPHSQNLKLLPALNLTVRSSLKTSRALASSTKSTRKDLTLSFGNKKSKKKIQAYAANSVGPAKPLAEDKVANAVLDSVVDAETVKKDKAQLAAAVDAARPVPKPKLEAKTPGEVYAVDDLVGGTSVLGKMRVKEWVEKCGKGEDVEVRSIFIAKRIPTLCKGGQGEVRMVRVLRYTYMLILWWKGLKSGKGPRSGKKVPRLDGGGAGHDVIVTTLVEEYGREVLNEVKERFSDGKGEVTRWHEDKLLTHILALTLVLDNWETDTSHIQFDLRLETKQAATYYTELGCEVKALNKGEYEKLGIGRVEAGQRRMARLKVPIKLPKARTYRGGRK